MNTRRLGRTGPHTAAFGLGWGMLLESQLADAAPGAFVELAPGGAGVAVPLYWQQWNLRSPALDALADAVVASARASLRPNRRGRSRGVG